MDLGQIWQLLPKHFNLPIKGFFNKCLFKQYILYLFFSGCQSGRHSSVHLSFIPLVAEFQDFEKKVRNNRTYLLTWKQRKTVFFCQKWECKDNISFLCFFPLVQAGDFHCSVVSHTSLVTASGMEPYNAESCTDVWEGKGFTFENLLSKWMQQTNYWWGCLNLVGPFMFFVSSYLFQLLSPKWVNF